MNLKTLLDQILRTAVGLHHTGDLRTAETLYKKALLIAPRQSDAQNLLGMAHLQSDKPAQAQICFQRATQILPLIGDYWRNLAAAGNLLQDLASAYEALQRGLILNPKATEVYSLLLHLLPKSTSSNSEFQTLRIVGRHSMLDTVQWHRLGSAALRRDKVHISVQAFKKSLAINPRNISSYGAYGYALMVRNDIPGSHRAFKWALCGSPDDPAHWGGLADSEYWLGNVKAAISHSQTAVKLAPDDPDLRFRHAIHRLSNGELTTGLQYYESRLQRSDGVKRHIRLPRWQGEPLDGKSILICSEQGIGDEIMYAANIQKVIAKCKHCVIECSERLVQTFTRSFPDATVRQHNRIIKSGHYHQRYDWITRSERPDYYIEAGSIAKFLYADLSDITPYGQYLAPNKDRTREFHRLLAPYAGKRRIGFSWRSSNTSTIRNPYYSRLSQWQPIFSKPGNVFVSLQYGVGWEEELNAARRETGAEIVEIPNLDTTEDIDGVLSLLSALDLIICPSSTIQWLGCALDMPMIMFDLEPGYVRRGQEQIPGFPNTRCLARKRMDDAAQTIEKAADLIDAYPARQIPSEVGA